jgi:hypothetical protein
VTWTVVVTAYVTPADASLNTTATAITTATAASTAANTTFPAACTFNSSLPIENVGRWQRYDSVNCGKILKETLFHTEQFFAEYELRKAAHVFGWWLGMEGGPAYVGWPRIKISLFFITFLESHNHREKLIL